MAELGRIASDQIKSATAEEDSYFAKEDERAAARVRAKDLERQIRGQAAGVLQGPTAELAFQEEDAKAIVDKTVQDHQTAEELKTLISREYAQRRIAIARQESDAEAAVNMQRLQATGTMFGNMAAFAKAFGQKGVAAYKAFSIAKATMDTASAAIAAYNSVVGIPYIGPILAPIAAAAAIAAGAAQISAIQSQSFEQGGYTGSGARTEIAGIVHKGEFVVPAHAVTPETMPFLSNLAAGGSTRTLTSAAGASSGETSTGGGKNNYLSIHAHFDKQAQLEALRDDVEGIALDVMRRNRARYET